MSSPAERASQSTWKDTAKRALKFAVVVGLFIWVFSIAIGARNTANANAEVINSPEWRAEFVPGGPDRFPDEFGSATEDEANAAIAESEYLWTSLTVKNVGEGEANDATVEIETATQVVHALAATSGYGNEAIVAQREDGNQRLIDVDITSLDSGDQAVIFLAMQPEGYARPYDGDALRRWMDEYSTYLVRSTIDSDAGEYVVYGDAMVPAEDQES